jgi:hypothetical protein
VNRGLILLENNGISGVAMIQGQGREMPIVREVEDAAPARTA